MISQKLLSTYKIATGLRSPKLGKPAKNRGTTGGPLVIPLIGRASESTVTVAIRKAIALSILVVLAGMTIPPPENPLDT